jgi:hypothetical protein
VLDQQTPQRLPGRWTDLTPVHQTVIIDVIESDLPPMHVETAYHRHRDLLELLKNFSDAHMITERLSRGGPHHMSSLSWFLSGVGALDAQGGGGVADMSLLLLWLRKTWLPLRAGHSGR